MKKLFLRMLMATCAASIVAIFTPNLIALPTAWLAERIVIGGQDWIRNPQVCVTNSAFYMEGQIRTPFVQINGQRLSDLPGRWRQGLFSALAVFITACVALALPSISIRGRILTFIIGMPIVTLLTAADLSIQALHAALAHLGYEILPHLNLADVPENHTLFADLERRFECVDRLKIFSDSGGRLFVAAWIMLSVAVLFSTNPKFHADAELSTGK